MGRGVLGFVVAVALVASTCLSPPAFAADDANDDHDPYFNEDEYTDVLHAAGSVAAGLSRAT